MVRLGFMRVGNAFRALDMMLSRALKGCIELFVVWCRRFLTLPQPPGCSTISVSRLSFRVRNGSGRFPAAIGHRQTLEASDAWLGVLCQILCSGRKRQCVSCLYLCLLFPHSKRSVCVCFGLLVPVAFTPCGASRSGLSTPSSVGDLKYETSS